MYSDPLRPREGLLPQDRDAMYRLLARHFQGVSREQFEEDLAGKNWVILLRDGSGELHGFTTLHFQEAHDAPGTFSVLYSGDTIVDPGAWGSSGLLRAWLDGVLRLRDQGDPSRPLYWLLLTSGFRTYRFLPLFWKWFFPRFDASTPPHTQALIDRLARERFGDLYHPAEGIVRFPRPQRLRGHLAGIPPGRMEDPHVHFFARRNPGAEAGDELVSVTRIEEGNLTAPGLRVLRSLFGGPGAKAAP